MVPQNVAALLDFYTQNRRDLPWRNTSDPYAILVSEVMLQQTQVEAVKGHFVRFTERFPTYESLAQASLEEVLATWSGLGYYSRARRLWETAQALVACGGFPPSRDALAALPGIGDYTSAAVASIAFGQPCVALDTNAIRVFARYYGVTEDPARVAVRRRLVQAVQTAIPPERAGDFTQAVMELGALVCRPRQPKCRQCPLRNGCLARRLGLAESIPPPRKKRETVDVLRVAAQVEQAGELLLVRAPQGLFEKMWVPPSVDIDHPEAAEVKLEQLFSSWARVRVGPLLGEVRHGITFRRIRCLVYQVELTANGVAEGETRWVPRHRLADTPLPSFAHKVLRLTPPSDRSARASSPGSSRPRD
ncbi:MAG: A/G-specific adenine glycosylase [Vulcanimicrobiota bacterium]